MRHQTALAAMIVLAAGAMPITSGLAQGNPSVDQMVKSLTPTGPVGATRGIHVGPGSAAPATTPGQPAAAQPAPSVSLTVQFATGSAELTPQAVQALNDLGKALTNPSLAAYRFRIEGHTDTVGSPDYNKALSDRRAASVVDYLASNFHVDRNRLEPIGMGEDGLLVPTPDQTPEPRNRRVVVVNAGS